MKKNGYIIPSALITLGVILLSGVAYFYTTQAEQDKTISDTKSSLIDKINIDENRITKLETQYTYISDSLDEIKAAVGANKIKK